MLLVNSFLFCGVVCMIAQIILDNTKLTPGHVTSMFVVFGAFLDSFSFYDKIIKVVGGGALLPITSFGHSLIHGALAKANEYGILGILMGMSKTRSNLSKTISYFINRKCRKWKEFGFANIIKRIKFIFN